MPIAVTCPHCQSRLKIPDDPGGRTIRCPRCKRRISHPAEGPKPAPTTSCPHCGRKHKFQLQKARNVHECTNCGGRFTPMEGPVQGTPLPDSGSPDDSATQASEVSSQGDIAFGGEGGTLSRPRSSSGALVAIAAAVLVVTGGIGAAVYFASRPGVPDVPGDMIASVGGRDDVRERNADYFEILETSFEIVAVLEAANFWRVDYSRYPAFSDSRAGEAADFVSDTASDYSYIIEKQQVKYRGEFVKKHGMDSKDWRPQFTKQFPERDVIFEEIKVVVRTVSQRQIRAVNDHLQKKKSELLTQMEKDPILADAMVKGDNFEKHNAEYRERYLRDQAPKMIREVEDEVKQLKSIHELRKKVMGVHPNPG